MRRHFFNYCIRQLLKDMRLKKLFPEIVKYSKEINCDGILSIKILQTLVWLFGWHKICAYQLKNHTKN